MHPYLIEQLADERRAHLLRQAAVRRTAHPGGRRGGRRLRAAYPAGMPPSVIAELQEQIPGGAAESRERVLR